MSNLFWLSAGQTTRLRPFLPRPLGRLRVGDWRVLSGIIHVNCNGLRCCDAAAAYGLHKTLYTRLSLEPQGRVRAIAPGAGPSGTTEPPLSQNGGSLASPEG